MLLECSFHESTLLGYALEDEHDSNRTRSRLASTCPMWRKNQFAWEMSGISKIDRVFFSVTVTTRILQLPLNANFVPQLSQTH